MELNPTTVDLEELAMQELTSSELHELLERLSAEEIRPAGATVSAVSEATGTSVLAVGRILADIRQQNLQELFGVRLDKVEGQVGSQQSQIKDLERSVAVARSEVREVAKREAGSVTIHQGPQYIMGDDAIREMSLESQVVSLIVTVIIIGGFLALISSINSSHKEVEQRMEQFRESPFAPGIDPSTFKPDR